MWQAEQASEHSPREHPLSGSFSRAYPGVLPADLIRTGLFYAFSLPFIFTRGKISFMAGLLAVTRRGPHGALRIGGAWASAFQLGVSLFIRPVASTDLIGTTKFRNVLNK